MRAANEAEVAACVRDAREKRRPVEIAAGGTRRGCGRPMGALEMLDVSGLNGIVSYEPEELILTAAPGTTLEEIAALLAAKGQRLGFDPADWSGLFGASGAPTLGGALSSDASGPGAVRFGRARESLLGIRAVNGLGEAFKAGGKVVKNVTGFDIPKLVCGAFGTLCVLTEVTFRVFPKPVASASFAVRGLGPQEGLALLREIWSGNLDPTGLAYVPGAAKFPALGDAGRGAALVRIEGAALPLKEKSSALRSLLARHDVMEIGEGDVLFAAIGNGAVFADEKTALWRVAVPPSSAAAVAENIAAPLWLADWAGGLLWIASDETKRVRAVATEVGGHAMLLRAADGVRARAGLFAPQLKDHAALTRAVKAAFDPLGLFNPGRLYEGI